MPVNVRGCASACATNLPDSIMLGWSHDQYAHGIVLDISREMEKWPESVPMLIYIRPGETVAYPATTTNNGGTLTWYPDAFATDKKGSTGSAQIAFVTAEDPQNIVGHSKVMRLAVKASIDTSTEPEGPIETWLEQMLQAAATTVTNAAAAEAAAQMAEGHKNDAEAAQEAAETARDNAQESETAAAQSAQNADADANLSKSWAVGSTGTRTGEDTDNSKYYAGRAKAEAEAAADDADLATRKAQAAAQSAADANADSTAAEQARAAAVRAKDDAVTAKNESVEAKETAEQVVNGAIAGIQAEGTAQVSAVNSTGTTQVAAVNSAGTTQVGNVNAAGATQVAAVQDKGDEVLDSIPQDYQQVVADLSDLKSQTSNICEQIFDTESETGTQVIVKTFSSIAEITSDNNTLVVKHTGKNLTKTNRTASITTNGVTLTPQEDGSIKIQGTSTAEIAYQVTPETPSTARKTLKAGTYTLSGGLSNSVYLMIAGFGQGNVYEKGNGVSFTISEDRSYYLKIIISNGQTVDTVMYPMIEPESVKTEFEPYKEETITLSNGVAKTQLFGGTDVFSASESFAVSYFVKGTDDLNTINLKTMGAVGDGLTDDTDAIRQAFTKASGKELFIPEGTYLFSQTLTIPTNTKVRGCGDKSLFKLADTFGLDQIVHREDQGTYKYPMIRLADNAQGCILENFKLKGQTSAFKDENEIGILITGSDHVVNNVFVEDINFFPDDFAGRVNNGPAWGFMIFHAKHIKVSNCKGINCGYEALGTEDTTDCLIDNFEAGYCNQTCLQVHRNSYDIVFNSCVVDYVLPEGKTVRPAFTMHGASAEHDMDAIKIVNCKFYGGITFIGGYEAGVSIIDNTVSGGVTMNSAISRKNVFIIGNRFGGGINGRYQNAVIVGNMATNNSSARFIIVNGENIICAHNIPLGSGKNVSINDVLVEQWGVNPSAS